MDIVEDIAVKAANDNGAMYYATDVDRILSDSEIDVVIRSQSICPFRKSPKNGVCRSPIGV